MSPAGAQTWCSASLRSRPSALLLYLPIHARLRAGRPGHSATCAPCHRRASTGAGGALRKDVRDAAQLRDHAGGRAGHGCSEIGAGMKHIGPQHVSAVEHDVEKAARAHGFEARDRGVIQAVVVTESLGDVRRDRERLCDGLALPAERGQRGERAGERTILPVRRPIGDLEPHILEPRAGIRERMPESLRATLGVEVAKNHVRRHRAHPSHEPRRLDTREGSEFDRRAQALIRSEVPCVDESGVSPREARALLGGAPSLVDLVRWDAVCRRLHVARPP
jgi:hypothetical protein